MTEEWEWPEVGEETLAHRQTVRELALHREALLRGMRIDPRLIDFVWVAAPARLEFLVDRDLRDVSWLDEKLANPDFSRVPLLNLETWEAGVIVELGVLYEQDEHTSLPIEVWEIWERVFEPGLVRLAQRMADGEVPEALCDADGHFDPDGLLQEFFMLGGPALVRFVETALSLR